MRLALILLPLCLALACGDKDADDDDDGSDGVDADGDGYASVASGGEDCDDADPSVHPFAEEGCNGVDDDCDGVVDEDSASDAVTWYPDEDGDGYGDDEAGDRSCEAPGATWIEQGGDCDDGNAEIRPGVEEQCDGVDQDCDGEVDEEAADAVSWYRDVDEDGYGGVTEVLACSAPDDGATWQLQDGDCDDSSPEVNPGAAEVCDEVDNDCDGLVDDEDSDVDEASWSVYYRDADEDGHGDAADPELSCGAPEGYVSGDGDCDDGDPGINPDAAERCDDADTDEDCDGLIDDLDDSVSSGSLGTWVPDGDRDGYGNPTATAVFYCDDPSGGGLSYAFDDATDCDDGDAAVNPGATEVCDAADIDEDCDGVADDDDSSTDPGTISHWYADRDRDGYGAGAVTLSCEDPSTGGAAYVDNDGDCDDGNASVSPAATEVCDDADTDEDCDGLVDDADVVDPDTATRYYADRDGDGYGAADDTLEACEPPGDPWIDDASDCDDGDGDIHPGATETCDAVDQDCDPDTEGTGISFRSSTGASTDLTATFGAGTASSPVAWSSTAAGTLSFCGGTTYANLRITHDITLTGTPGTVLHGAGEGPVVTAVGSTVDLVIANLTLTGGDGTTASTGGTITGGGGLACYQVASLTLEDLVVTDNAATYGAGMLLERCPTVAQGIEVSDNDGVSGYGQGIYIYLSEVELTDSQVVDNSSYTFYGGGILVSGPSSSSGGSLALVDSTVSGNRAYFGGAGIALVRGSVSCSGGSIVSNENYHTAAPYSGGGIYIDDKTGNTLESDGCDWGSGATDNDPDDIFLIEIRDSYDVPASGDISCTYASCR